ncbi:tripartite tricarboxylate transporter substrate binding protein [Ramlibacter sp. 2FC]|uniref:Bug family tripartite tricarboxylate transporter substrate binding protein n=1 Tax=Ramlibacter sp. 2FC TaxID=2502188 RepID=UPI0010F8C47C|nr:tripartite tricarboxylate transporter substrate binding protein [Ramlibacter sp. 2FC]
MISRRKILEAVPALAATAFAGGAVAQSAYPTRLVKIVVGNAAGGTDDAISRFVADRLAKEFGQPVIVENRGGGSTTIAGTYVASAPADGYTLMCLINTGINQTVLRDKLPYKLSSFTPVAGVGGFPVALAVSATAKPKITNMQELVAAARSGDGITFGSGGVGTMGHLTCTRLLNAIKGKGVHVSYRNNPEGLQALIGGHTQMFFASASEVSGLRGEDKLRVLAVATPQRAVNLPDVPTMKELGFPDFDVALWHGFVAPAGTPPDIVAKLADGITRAVRDPEFLNRYAPLAYQENIKTGEALSAFINAEAARWKEVIVANNIRLE